MNFGGKMGSCDVTRWTKNCLRSTFQCDLPVCFSWQVVANCLFVLQEIWNLEANKSEEASRERETLLSKKIVYYILNRYAPSWLIMSYLISFSDQLFFHCFLSSHMGICIIQNGLDLTGYSDFSLFFFWMALFVQLFCLLAWSSYVWLTVVGNTSSWEKLHNKRSSLRVLVEPILQILLLHFPLFCSPNYWTMLCLFWRFVCIMYA